MSKYQVGDRVKVLIAKVPGVKGQAGIYVGNLENYVEKVGTVTRVGPDHAKVAGFPYYIVEFKDGEDWAYDERCLRRVRKAVVPEVLAKVVEAVVEAPVALPEDAEKPPKFKAGDRVRIVKAELPNQYGGFSGGMREYENKEFVIKGLIGRKWEGHRIGYSIVNTQYSWDEECLELAREPVALHPRCNGPFIVGDVIAPNEANKGHSKIGGRKALTVNRIAARVIYLDGLFEGYYANRFVLVRPVEWGADDVVVAPIIPKPIEIKEKLDPLLQHRIDFAKKVDDNGVGTCSFFKQVGKEEFIDNQRAACAANITTYYDGDKKTVLALVLNVKGHLKGLTPEQTVSYHRYIQYIILRSPWSSLFKTQDMSEVLELGVEMDVARNIKHIASAAIALREGSEYPHETDMFCKMLDKGYSEDAAYLMARCISSENQWIGFRNGHKVLEPGISFKGLCKFFKEGFAVATKQPYHTHNNSYGLLYPELNMGMAHDGPSITNTIQKIVGKSAPAAFGQKSAGLDEKKVLKAAKFFDQSIKEVGAK